MSVLDEIADEVFPAEKPTAFSAPAAEKQPAATVSVLDEVADEVFEGKPPKEPEPGILSRAASAVTSAVREGVSATPFGRALGFKPTGPAVAAGAAAPPKDVALPQGPTPEALKATGRSASVIPEPVAPPPPVPVKLGPVPGLEAVTAEAQKAPLLERVSGAAPGSPLPVPERPAPGGMLGRAAATAGVVDPETVRRRAAEAEFAASSVMAKPEGVDPGWWQVQQDIKQARRVVSAMPDQFANRVLFGIPNAIKDTFGFDSPQARAPQSTAEAITGGTGDLAGFIVGPAKVAHAMLATNITKALAPQAGNALGTIMAKSIANEAATLAVASGLAHAGDVTQADSMKEAFHQLGEHVKGGAILGATFGGLGNVIPANTLMQRAARLGVGLGVLDVVQGTSITDDRALAQKVYDYGLNVYFLWKGKDPRAIKASIETAAAARSKPGAEVTPEQVLKSVLDKATERAAKLKDEPAAPGAPAPDRSAELSAILAEELAAATAPLKSAAEVAVEKTGGQIISAPAGAAAAAPEIVLAGGPRPAARPAAPPRPTQNVGIPGQVPTIGAGPVRILGPSGRPVDAIPAPVEGLKSAQDLAAERAKGISRPARPASQAPPAAVPEVPSGATPAVAAASADRPVPSLSFKDYVEVSGKKWPLTSREPDYARLRFEFDDMKKGLYEARPVGDGRWAVINRKTGEEVDHLPSGAKAQLESNRLNVVVTLDAWRNAQVPQAPVRMVLPERKADLSAKPAPEPTVEPGSAAAQQKETEAALTGPKPSAEPPAPAKAPAPPAASVLIGKTQEIRVPAGSKYQIRYEVVEADSMIPSHDPRTFAKDPRYPEGVQNRPYHSDKSEQAKVIRQGQDFEPLFLVSPQPSSGGTPIIAPDSNVVLSGNSRTMSLLRTRGTEAYDRYKAALAEMAPALGLKAEDLAKVQNPVLVRRLVGTDTTPEFYRRFAEETNQGFKKPPKPDEEYLAGGQRVAEEEAPYGASGSPEGEKPRAASASDDRIDPEPQSSQEPLTQAEVLGSQRRTDAPPSGVSTTRDRVPSERVIEEKTAGSAIAATSTPSVKQPVRTVNELLKIAVEHQPGVTGSLKDAIRDIPGAEFLSARIKALDSIEAKTVRKDADADALHDYLGARITVATPEALGRVVDAIERRFRTVEKDDKREAPTAWGYRAMHLDMKTPDGFIFEVQVLPKEVAVYQDLKPNGGHVLYKRWQGRDDLTVAQRDQFAADMAESNARYQAAYDAWRGQGRVAEKPAEYTPEKAPEPELPDYDLPPVSMAEVADAGGGRGVARAAGGLLMRMVGGVAEPKAGYGSVQIRAASYRDKPGFTISGTDTQGRSVKVFSEHRHVAEHIRGKILRGEETMARDFDPEGPARSGRVAEPKALTEGQPLFSPESPYAASQAKARKGATTADRETAQLALFDLDQAAKQPVESIVEKKHAERATKRPLRGENAGAGVRTVSRTIDEFKDKGFIDFRGQTVREGPEGLRDLAVIGQIARDPRYETFRYFYTKGDTIVGSEAFSSRLPGATNIHEGVQRQPAGGFGMAEVDLEIARRRTDQAKSFAGMRRRMERLGADGYYVMHNHPSGRAEPSREDLNTTEYLASKVPGFKGHVVIDSGEYARIVLSDRGHAVATVERLDAQRLDAPKAEDPLLRRVGTQKILSAEDLAQIGRNLKTPENYVSLVHGDASGAVRAVQEMPVNLFMRETEAQNFIRGQQRAFGASSTFAVFKPTGMTLDQARQYIRQGVLTDAIAPGAPAAESALNVLQGRGEMPISGTPREPERDLRTVRVQEEREPYGDFERLKPETRQKLVDFGRDVLKDNKTDFASWSKAMREKLGEKSAGTLPGAWSALMQEQARTQAKPTARPTEGKGGKPPEPPQDIPRSAPPIEPAPGLSEPQLKLGLHKDLLDAAESLFRTGKIERDPTQLLSDQILDAIRDEKIRVEDLVGEFDRRNVNVGDFFRSSVSNAARRMGALGLLQQRINRLEAELAGAGAPPKGPRRPGDPDEPERLQKIKTIGDLLDVARAIDPVTQRGPFGGGKPMAWWRRADNIQRGMLVTRLSTATWNFGTQVGRLGIDVLDQGIQGGLQRAFGKEVTAHPADSFRALMEVFAQANPAEHKRVRGLVDALLEGLPREQDRLFNNYSADVQRVAKTQGAEKIAEKAFGVAEKTVETLNIFNRFQEYVVRRAVFQAELDAKLRARGIDIEVAAKDDAVRRKIPITDIRDAIQRSLELTFSEAPAFGSPGYNFVKWMNGVPGLSLLTGIRFPRFMVNSIKFFFEFSPLGFTKMITPAERAKFRQGDMKTISRATLGLGLLGAAYLIRSQQDDDTKWNEIRLPGMEDAIDIRRANPFAAYLFVADLAHRAINGRLYGGNIAAETAKAVLGVNVRGGTGLQMMDQLVDGLRDIGDTRGASKYVQELVGNTLAGFLTPLSQLADVYGEFDPETRIIRNTREVPFWGPMKRNLPAPVADMLPGGLPSERSSPTTTEPQLKGGIKGLFGVATRPKNDFEKELDRLQFSYRNVLPSQGDPRLDNMLAAKMGPLAEVEGGRLVNSTRFQGLGEIGKRLALTAYLERLRKKAKAKAMLDREYREIAREVKAGVSKERLKEMAKEEKAGLR